MVRRRGRLAWANRYPGFTGSFTKSLKINVVANYFGSESALQVVASDVHFFRPESCGEMAVEKKVLVVDDSMSELKLMKQLLEEGGYHAVGISDPTKIEETIDAEHPSVILLDVVMPVRNGFQACRELKNHEIYGTIPVILVSSKTSPSDKYWGEQQGANGYVFKPFTQEDLIQAVRKFT